MPGSGLKEEAPLCVEETGLRLVGLEASRGLQSPGGDEVSGEAGSVKGLSSVPLVQGGLTGGGAPLWLLTVVEVGEVAEVEDGLACCMRQWILNQLDRRP